MRALIIGCGYLGQRVADLWRSAGVDVSALTRSPEHAAELQRRGIEPTVGDVLRPESLRLLPAVDCVLYAVGFDRRAPASKRDVYVGGLANVLQVIGSKVSRLLYVSSTSVYGQNAGEWIDETSETRPATEDGQIVLDAEKLVRDSCPKGTASVLRFSGIYGPNRLLRRIESLRGGEPIQANPDGYLNLIHVNDGARIVTGVAHQATIEDTYLVSDDQPVLRRDYYTCLAQLVGVGEPVFQSSEAGLNKRCSNARVKAELGDVFEFPTFESGLRQAVSEARE